uniref:uncharacterized protein LOC117606005 n=1 Tax=Osmia lignaria TaxID=473952 RepID=UPI0014790C0E|nr:uncharacterized protein LOC117606005 [Osmia lignaria]
MEKNKRSVPPDSSCCTPSGVGVRMELQHRTPTSVLELRVSTERVHSASTDSSPPPLLPPPRFRNHHHRRRLHHHQQQHHHHGKPAAAPKRRRAPRFLRSESVGRHEPRALGLPVSVRSLRVLFEKRDRGVRTASSIEMYADRADRAYRVQFIELIFADSPIRSDECR